MAIKLGFFVLLISFSRLFFPISSITISDRGINAWCKKTPYPHQCKHFMNHGSYHFGPKNKIDFKKMAMQIALERALQAETYTRGLGIKCRNELEKAAWSDCVKLYENTILQLNKTLDSNTKCTDFDVQTYLSTAMTNLETCRTGFIELGVNSDYILPNLMSNNVSELICNSLALNNNGSKFEQTYKDGFPTWLSPGDRKLLQSSSVRPNVVVAQDGTGNFRTIKAALDAAAKRSGNGRFVIHVKQGVYRENLEIGNKMKNIMLVGDGMKYTIITGSRSVGGGSTTFNSGTVGKLYIYCFFLYLLNIAIFVKDLSTSYLGIHVLFT